MFIYYVKTKFNLVESGSTFIKKLRVFISLIYFWQRWINIPNRSDKFIIMAYRLIKSFET